MEPLTYPFTILRSTPFYIPHIYRFLGGELPFSHFFTILRPLGGYTGVYRAIRGYTGIEGRIIRDYTEATRRLYGGIRGYTGVYRGI